jgi:hypothetical protein
VQPPVRTGKRGVCWVLIFGFVFDFGTAALLSALGEVGPAGVSTASSKSDVLSTLRDANRPHNCIALTPPK